MKHELFSSSHAVGEANYHIQLTPAYRCPIFADECVRVLTRDYMLAAAMRWKITISAISFGPDHSHVFCAQCKNYSVAKLVGLLKGFSSYMMRKNHANLLHPWLRKKKFWSGGYFYRTVGAVNAVTVRRYVEESQSKHWKVEKAQRSLLEF